MAKIVVISGPSGVGKTTVCNRLLECGALTRAITATTRPPRPGEQHGRDYFFFTKDEFQQRLKENFFLEHATVFGKLYGTPRSEVERVLNEGRSVLLNIDVQGADTLRQQADLPIVTIFIMPPSMEVLEARLRGRSTDNPEVIERRLQTARQEIEQRHLFDHAIINDKLDDAVEQIRALVI